MKPRRSVTGVIAEGIREVGVLVSVFCPLDSAFNDHSWPFMAVVGTTLVMGVGTFAIGVALERYRSWEEV